MKCISCGKSNTRVKRTIKKEDYVIRYRQCPSCNITFTTQEMLVKIDLEVIKRGGRHEHFDPDKIRMGIQRASHRLGLEPEDELDILRNVLKDVVRKTGDGKEIKSEAIAESVLKYLRPVSDQAWLRYAVVSLRDSALNVLLEQYVEESRKKE